MKKFISFPFLFLVSFFIVAVFSTSTTFLYNEPCSGDSAIFQIIGKYWAEGRIPYVDVWDQKGPFIFFVDALGYLITSNQIGIFILQVLNITAVAWILYLICRIEFHEVPSLLLTTVVLLSFAPVCENTVEEWILIPLCWAYYRMLKWVNEVTITSHTVIHPVRYAFLYGIVFGLSLMTRLTNAVGICMASFVIFMYLAKKGERKNIIGNSLSFIVGFLLTTTPFVFYFYAHNALYDMWYGTFIYNAEYAGRSGFSVFSLKGLANIILRFENCYFLLFVAAIVLFLNNQRRFAGVLWFTMSLACMIWFLRSNGFGQYATICLPFSCIAMIELHKSYMLNKSQLAKWNYKGGILAYTAVVIIGAIYSLWLFNHMYRNNVALAEFRAFMKDVPVEYKQSLAAYNCPADWYLYEDIHPNCRYFTLQDYQSSMGGSLLEKVRQEFSNKTKWLLVKGQKTKIDDILERNYTIVKQNGNLTLYKYRAD